MRSGNVKCGWITASLAIATLVVIACGNSATATPLPTAAATPAPTATPAPQIATTSDDESLVEVDTDALRQYLDAIGPVFQQASLDRQAVDQDLTAPAPGRNTQVEDAAA